MNGTAALSRGFLRIEALPGGAANRPRAILGSGLEPIRKVPITLRYRSALTGTKPETFSLPFCYELFSGALQRP